jgi:catechol 2,3-dioxygenase-like lactoylglutathione lyase family enzyme
MKAIGLVPELYVSDLEKTLTFYIGIVGFEILYRREEEKFAYLQRENARMMFEQIGASRTWITGELQQPFGRGINFQIEASTVDHLYRTVKKNNLQLFLELEEKWYRKDNKFVGNKQFLIQDPDGYLLRFYQELGTRAQDPSKARGTMGF